MPQDSYYRLHQALPATKDREGGSSSNAALLVRQTLSLPAEKPNLRTISDGL